MCLSVRNLSAFLHNTNLKKFPQLLSYYFIDFYKSISTFVIPIYM